MLTRRANFSVGLRLRLWLGLALAACGDPRSDSMPDDARSADTTDALVPGVSDAEAAPGDALALPRDATAEQTDALAASPDAGPPSPPRFSRLHAEGRRLVNADGEPVRLRGVNLGGLFFHETWITAVDYPESGRLMTTAEARGQRDAVAEALREVGPGDDAGWHAALRGALTARLGDAATDALLAEAALRPSIYDDSDLPLRRLLSSRFGDDGRDALLDAFQAAWVTEADLEWLAGQGFNLVRIPIGYRSLLSGPDTDGVPASLVWNERALSRLDHLLDACARHRLWAVVDLQESPGGHNAYSGEPHLYDDPDALTRTVEFWTTLAERLVDRDEVAAYSLLAEPYSAPDAEARDAVYGVLHDALRARGDDHLLVLHDGFMGMGSFPTRADRDWRGVIYSTHVFEWGATSVNAYDVLARLYRATWRAAQSRQDVPYFVGSFSTMQDTDWAYASLDLLVGLFSENDWSWALWTYKRIDDPLERELYGTQTAWGLRGRLMSTLARPDVYLDSREVLEDKFRAYADLEIAPNEAMLAPLTTRR